MSRPADEGPALGPAPGHDLDPVEAPLLRPTWRGRLHQVAFVVSIGTGLAVVLTASSAASRAAATVYALSVTGLFGSSALYHRGAWSPRTRRHLQRLDHSMILVLIAGTCTPLAALVLPHRHGVVVLAVVWAVAAVGVGLRVLWSGGPNWLVYPLSLVVGLATLSVLPYLLDRAGVVVLVLLLLGCLVYLLGMAILISRRPDPRPLVFGYHEVFHALTLVAGLLFFAVNVMVVARA